MLSLSMWLSIQHIFNQTQESRDSDGGMPPNPEVGSDVNHIPLFTEHKNRLTVLHVTLSHITLPTDS